MPTKNVSTLPTKALETTNIKGKEYVDVSSRLKYFRETYGATMSLVSKVIHLTDDVAVIEAQVIDADGKVVANGVAREVRTDTSSFVNKTSYLENCETSAWGRALANFGIGIDNSVASANEVVNAISQREAAQQQPQQPAPWNQPQPQPTQQTPPWQTQPQQVQQQVPQQQPQQVAHAPAQQPAQNVSAPQGSDQQVTNWLNEVANIQDANQLTEFITKTNQSISTDAALVQKFQKEVVPFAQQHYRSLTGQLTS